MATDEAELTGIHEIGPQVVAGPGAGSKLEQARARDVPVMDEEAFVKFLDDASAGATHE